MGWDLRSKTRRPARSAKIVETDGVRRLPGGLERCTSFVQRAEWSADGRWVAFEVSYGSLDRLNPGVRAARQRGSGSRARSVLLAS